MKRFLPILALCSTPLLLSAAEWHMDPEKVVTSTKCVDCHANQVLAWKDSRHYKVYSTAHRHPDADRIAKAMGLSKASDMRKSQPCISCHYTLQGPQDNPKAKSGTSCESCHGPAQDWIGVHNQFVTGVTAANETPEQYAERIGKAEAKGMLNPRKLYDIAQNCYKCHTVPNEKLVNVAGHKAGSPFELVSWFNGTVKHNFKDDNAPGAENTPTTPERQHAMYVIGRALDLEYGLRGVAQATGDNPFAQAMVTRVLKARNHLVAIHKAGCDIPEVMNIIKLTPGPDKYDFGNSARFVKIADTIQKQARNIDKEKAAYKDKLAKVQGLIPPPFVPEP